MSGLDGRAILVAVDTTPVRACFHSCVCVSGQQAEAEDSRCVCRQVSVTNRATPTCICGRCMRLGCAAYALAAAAGGVLFKLLWCDRPPSLFSPSPPPPLQSADVIVEWTLSNLYKTGGWLKLCGCGIGRRRRRRCAAARRRAAQLACAPSPEKPIHTPAKTKHNRRQDPPRARHQPRQAARDDARPAGRRGRHRGRPGDQAARGERAGCVSAPRSLLLGRQTNVAQRTHHTKTPQQQTTTTYLKTQTGGRRALLPRAAL